MPLVISVAQRKGGVGKTTLAVLLAGELDRRTRAVGLVDADSRASACHWAEPGNLVVSSLPARSGNPAGRRMGQADAPDSASDHRGGLCTQRSRARRSARGRQHRADALHAVRPRHRGHRADSLDIVREVRATRRTALRAMIVPNRVDQRTLEGQQFIEELDTFGEQIGPMIGSRSAYVRAFALGQSVADFAGGTPADIEIKTLADLVMSWAGIAPRQRVTV